MNQLVLATLSLIIVGMLEAHAAIVETVRSSDGLPTVIISGELQRGDDEKFANVASAVAGDAYVWLDSLGGSLAAGLRIGTAIRLRAWKTVVPENSTCASACGLIWLGGISRTVGPRARVGFHAAFVLTDGHKFETGSGNALAGSYLNRLGLSDAAVVYLTSASPDEAAWLSDSVAKQLGIRADFIDVAGPRQLAFSTPQVPAVRSEPAIEPAPGSRTGNPNSLLAELYRNFPFSVHLSGQTCVGRQCKIRLVDADEWIGRDGFTRRIVLGAAEVKNDCHACSAILGVGVFRAEAGNWQQEVANPAVTRVGSWDTFQGKVTFVDGGVLGRVVIVEESDMGQGTVDSLTSLLLPVGRGYRRVIDIPTAHDLGGFCDIKEPDCQKRAAEENYTSKLSIRPGGDGTIRVVQTFTAASPIPLASWIVNSKGIAKQTGGGQALLGSGAQQRASIITP